MRLFIHTSKDFFKCVITLNVELADTIEDIKARALNLLAVETLNGAALWDRHTLMDNRRTLMYYNLRDGDTLGMAWTEL